MHRRGSGERAGVSEQRACGGSEGDRDRARERAYDERARRDRGHGGSGRAYVQGDSSKREGVRRKQEDARREQKDVRRERQAKESEKMGGGKKERRRGAELAVAEVEHGHVTLWRGPCVGVPLVGLERFTRPLSAVRHLLIRHSLSSPTNHTRLTDDSTQAAERLRRRVVECTAEREREDPFHRYVPAVHHPVSCTDFSSLARLFTGFFCTVGTIGHGLEQRRSPLLHA